MKDTTNNNLSSEVTPPLPLNTLQQYVQQIFDPIRRGECVTTVWLPMLGRRITNKYIIKYPDLFPNEINQDDKYILVYIEPLELTEESAVGYINLIIKSVQQSYENLDSENRSVLVDIINDSKSYPEALDNLNKQIKQITSFGHKIVLFLGEFDELEFANQVLLNNLKSVWARFEGDLYFIFLVLSDVVRAESIKKFGELNELILKNVVYIPLLNKEGIESRLDRFSKQYNRTLSSEERNLIVNICGGHPYLLKSCVRLIALLNGSSKKSNELKDLLINHYEPRSACQKLFNLLDIEEQEMVKRISLGQNVPAADLDSSRLVKSGLVIKDAANNWRLFGELFKSVVDHDQKKTEEINIEFGEMKFDEKSGAILIGNINIEEKFTRQEYEILSFFMQEPNKLHTRDEISEAMWGKEAYEKYSDWAIDQIMSKIRKKLQNLGVGKSLVTIRGRGYKLALD